MQAGLQKSSHASLQGYEEDMKRQRLSHIVIPFIPSQVESLKNTFALWESLAPCDPSQPTHPFLPVEPPQVVFFVAQRTTSSESERSATKRDILDSYQNLPTKVRQCFGQAVYVIQELTPEQDSHVEGARLMFEHFLRNKDFISDATYAFYMEPDVRPISNGWLNRLVFEVSWPEAPFWVKGSIYRGTPSNVDGSSYTPNLYHLNGNAIYDMGGALSEFYFQKVRPYVEQAHGQSVNAYDTDFSEYLMQREHFSTVIQIAHMFRFSEVIQNMWNTHFSASELSRQFPRTGLVHGGTYHD